MNSIKTSLNPGMYREEFERYRSRYTDEGKDKDLIMTYIMLQVYVENFMHYWMYHLVGGSGSRGSIDGWRKKDYVETKLDKFKSYLNKQGITTEQDYFAGVKDNFVYIKDIRDKFVHGHPITKKRPFKMKDGNDFEESDAKKYLSQHQLDKALLKANKLAKKWNQIMKNVENQLEDSPNNTGALPESNFMKHCLFKLF